MNKENILIKVWLIIVLVIAIIVVFKFQFRNVDDPDKLAIMPVSYYQNLEKRIEALEKVNGCKEKINLKDKYIDYQCEGR